MSRRSRAISRARQRGVSTVGTVLESAMVMGWFVVLLLGEMSVSSAADARRSAENAAAQSATKSSANECRPQSVSVGKARTSPSVISNGQPQAQSAVALVQALGLGQQRTFPNYVKPLKNTLVQSTSSADEVPGDVNPAGKSFEGSRNLGCLEKPIDVPKGSMEEYRSKLWDQNLKGY
ncbi:MAG: pilus assembly protein [Labilithrix sp.]|nr:pilus assembly protein [Labilithrix sp.]